MNGHLSNVRVRTMPQGTVKWFSDQKGFGFIAQETGNDVYVHHTAIQATGFRTLHEGDKVSFELEESPRGLRANNVTKI
jgi:CspA family cold shock protein